MLIGRGMPSVEFFMTSGCFFLIVKLFGGCPENKIQRQSSLFCVKVSGIVVVDT